jgi:hypothetical protein
MRHLIISLEKQDAPHYFFGTNEAPHYFFRKKSRFIPEEMMRHFIFF